VLLEIKELQTAWEKKFNSPRFTKYHDANNDSLAKLNKYYLHLEKKPAFILALGMFSALLCSSPI